jgi:outer membrane protein W
MKYLLLILSVALSTSLFAQFSINVNAGPQMLHYRYSSNYYQFPLGAGVFISPQFEVQKYVRAEMTIGYAQVGFTEKYKSHIFVPFVLGAQFLYPKYKLKPFVGFSMGTLLYSWWRHVGNSNTPYRNVVKSYYTLSPSIGLEYALNENTGLSLRINANIINTQDYLRKPYVSVNTGANIGMYFKIPNPKKAEK